MCETTCSVTKKGLVIQSELARETSWGGRKEHFSISEEPGKRME